MSNRKINIKLLAESIDTKDLLNEHFVDALVESIEEEYGHLNEEELTELFKGLGGVVGGITGGISKFAGKAAEKLGDAAGRAVGAVGNAVGGVVKDAKFNYYQAEIKGMETKLDQMVQKLAKDYPNHHDKVGLQLQKISAALETVLTTISQAKSPAKPEAQQQQQAQQQQPAQANAGHEQMAGLMREGSKKKQK